MKRATCPADGDVLAIRETPAKRARALLSVPPNLVDQVFQLIHEALWAQHWQVYSENERRLYILRHVRDVHGLLVQIDQEMGQNYQRFDHVFSENLSRIIEQKLDALLSIYPLNITSFQRMYQNFLTVIRIFTQDISTPLHDYLCFAYDQHEEYMCSRLAVDRILRQVLSQRIQQISEFVPNVHRMIDLAWQPQNIDEEQESLFFACTEAINILRSDPQRFSPIAQALKNARVHHIRQRIGQRPLQTITDVVTYLQTVEELIRADVETAERLFDTGHSKARFSAELSEQLYNTFVFELIPQLIPAAMFLDALQSSGVQQEYVDRCLSLYVRMNGESQQKIIVQIEAAVMLGLERIRLAAQKTVAGSPTSKPAILDRLIKSQKLLPEFARFLELIQINPMLPDWAQTAMKRMIPNIIPAFYGRNAVDSPSISMSSYLVTYVLENIEKEQTDSLWSHLDLVEYQHLHQVLQYLSNKDQFMHTMHASVSRKLVRKLQEKRYIDHMEAFGQLIQSFGYPMPNVLPGLIQDCREVTETNAAFRRSPAGAKMQPAANYYVLRYHQWSLGSLEGSCVFPKELAQTLKPFETLYAKQFPYREHQWCPEISPIVFSLEVDNLVVTFDTNLAIYSALALLDTQRPITPDELRGKLQCSELMFQRIMTSLVKPKIVTADTNGIVLNREFMAQNTGKNIPIRYLMINQEIRIETQVQIDRRSITEAACVRIMKREKKLSFGDLFQRTKNEVKNWFDLDRSDFKDTVERMFDREYFLRDAKDTEQILYSVQ